MGLDVSLYELETSESDDLDNADKRSIEIPSTLHTEHLFKIGYLRSSYNPAGLNSVLRERIGKDLYTIFGLTFGETNYWIRPSWRDALKNTADALSEYQSFTQEHGALEVVTQSWGLDSAEVNEGGDALKGYLDEAKKHSQQKKHPMSTGCYSSSKGTFYLSDEKEHQGVFRAAIPGFNILNRPCMYIVLEHAVDNDEGRDWYIEALEIVREMCEWVLSHENPDLFILGWSA